MSKHTPGPWRLHGDGGTLVGSDGQQFAIVTTNTTNYDSAKGKSNLKLIVAAPLMLETLIDIVGQLTNHPDVKVGNSKVHYIYCMARNAIKEATGRLPK